MVMFGVPVSSSNSHACSPEEGQSLQGFRGPRINFFTFLIEVLKYGYLLQIRFIECLTWLWKSRKGISIKFTHIDLGSCSCAWEPGHPSRSMWRTGALWSTFVTHFFYSIMWFNFVTKFLYSLIWSTVVTYFCDPLLWFTFVIYFCDLLLWSLLWSTFLIHFCDPLLWSTFVIHFCYPLLWSTFIILFCD